MPSGQQAGGKTIIRLIGCLIAERNAENLTVAVDHNKTAGVKTAKRAFGYHHTVILTEIRSEARSSHDVVYPVDCAESGCRKRQIHRDAENFCVWQRRSLNIEPAHGCGAYVSVKARKNVSTTVRDSRYSLKK